VGADVAKRRTAAVAVDRCVSAGNPDTGRGCAGSCAGDPPPAVVQVGVRQDYIVQAESVEVARSAVVRVGAS